MKCMNPNTGSI